MVVEVIRIGNLLGNNKIMVKRKGDAVYMHYLDILRKNLDCSYIKCDEEMIKPSSSDCIWFSKKGHTNVKGDIERLPSEGDDIEIDHKMDIGTAIWRSGTIHRVIEDRIIVCDSSVYVLHSTEHWREKALSEIGI